MTCRCFGSLPDWITGTCVCLTKARSCGSGMCLRSTCLAPRCWRRSTRYCAARVAAQSGDGGHATLIAAPSSTRNASGERDPEKYQTKRHAYGRALPTKWAASRQRSGAWRARSSTRTFTQLCGCDRVMSGPYFFLLPSRLARRRFYKLPIPSPYRFRSLTNSSLNPSSANASPCSCIAGASAASQSASTTGPSSRCSERACSSTAVS